MRFRPVFWGIVLIVLFSAAGIGNADDDFASGTRTLDSLHRIRLAVQMFLVDNNHLPTAATIEELERDLVPVYLGTFPRADGWGTPFARCVARTVS